MTAFAGCDWYPMVPKDMLGNIRFRRDLLEWVKADDVGRDPKVRRRRRLVLWRACSRDILFFVNTFGMILEPRSTRKMPWVTWDFQDEAIISLRDSIIRAIEEEQPADVVQTKSRDMGASWLCVLVLAWFALFWPNFSALMLSRKADLVESEDPKSLFFKLDFIVNNLPKWLQPNMRRKEMLWRNLDNNSFIKGDHTTKFSGVADRTTALLLDEFSLMENQDQIWLGTRDVSRCRIANFTLRRYAIYSLDLAKKDSIKQIKLHWTRHPLKTRGLYTSNEPGGIIKILDEKYKFPADYKFVNDGKTRSVWYDTEEPRCQTPEEMAAEVDMLVQGTSLDVFDVRTLEWMKDTQARAPNHCGDLLNDPSIPNRVVLDERDSGPFRMWTYLVGRQYPSKASYVVGADIGMGVGSSDSVLSVWNRTTCEKVAEFVSAHIDPASMASKAIQVCNFFRDERERPALLKFESNGGPGSMFCAAIIEAGFGNVWFHRNRQSTSGKISQLPGWNSNAETKTDLLRTYAIAMRAKQLRVYCRESLVECGEYSLNDRGVPVHVESAYRDDPRDNEFNHGDRVIADALGFSECYREMFVDELIPERVRVASRDDLREIRDLMFAQKQREAKRAPWWKRGVYAKTG